MGRETLELWQRRLVERLILHNDNPKGHDSNLGLAVPGIQIYLPIAPSHALAFFCPTIKEELKKGTDKAGKIKRKLITILYLTNPF
jgi:hypothetical protein